MKLKHVIMLPVLLLSILPSNSQIIDEIQKSDIDSLLLILPVLKGVEKVDALNKIAWGLLIENPDSAILLSQKSITLSEDIDYKKGIADGYYQLGISYSYLDSSKLSVINYLNAIRIYENLKPNKEYGDVLMQLTMVNWITKRYDEAVFYCKKACEIYHTISNYKSEIFAYHSLGTLFRFKNQIDTSLKYYNKALDMLNINPDTWLLSAVYNGIALNYYEQYKQGEKGKEYVLKAISGFMRSWEIDTHNTVNYYTAESIYNIGVAFISIGDKDNRVKGLQYLSTAQKLLDTTRPFYYLTPMIYLNFGLENMKNNEYKLAEKWFKLGLIKADSGLEIFSLKNYNLLVLGYLDRYSLRLAKEKLLYELYKLYEQIKDAQSALEYYIMYDESNKEIYQEANRKLVATLEAASENEKTEKKIALLERDKQINVLKATQSRNLTIGIGSAFVFILLVGLLFFRQNKIRADQKTINLEQKLFRLQMNPHFIFNSLSGILLLMKKKDLDHAAQYLTSFSRLLRSTLKGSREDYILLEEEVESMQNYLNLQSLMYADKLSYSIEVDEAIDLENAIIPPMLIQPFVENAVIHGIKHKEEGGHVNLNFKLDIGRLICEVNDDGVGREKASEIETTIGRKHQSMATDIVHDRIQVLNKKLKQKINLDITDLKSETNEAIGTMVRLDLPYILD